MLKSVAMNPRPVKGRWLDVDEVRTVADLRIMHSKVDELYQVCQSLQERHGETAMISYADRRVLSEDIRKVDELYLWFVKLKEEAELKNRKRG
jgi:hypothetical protein